MPDPKGASVARREPSPAYAQWISAMTLEADLPDSGFDPRDILAGIIGADTWEDALARAETSLLSGKNIVGRAHIIHGFRLVPSDQRFSEHSLGVYAVVNATDLETLEDFTYAVGASNVLALLWQARQFSRLPGDFVITSRETENGELLSLRPVGARTVKVTE